MDSNNIKNIVENFFKLLGVLYSTLEIKIDGNIVNINIQTEESSIIIGYSGRNLDSIRLILKNIISKNIGESISLHIEINDYILSKDNKLFSFIDNKISYLDGNNEVILPFFNSYERKKIHSYIIEKYQNKGIFTKSLGEGKNRKLHLYKKNPSLTIDVDGIDI